MAWSRKKRLLWGSGAGGVLVTTMLLSLPLSGRVPAGNLGGVRQDSFAMEVGTMGHLDTASAFHAISTIRGDHGKIIKIIDDGAKVEKGDVLVGFDPTLFETEVQRLSG